MKLTYFFNGRFPTEKAHGVHIAKMCEAFARAGVTVTLVVPFRHNALGNDPFSYYDLQRNFTLKRTRAVDLMGYIPDIFANRIQTLTSLITFGFYVFSHRADMCYARDPASLLLLSFFGQPYVAEFHDYRAKQPRWWMKRVIRKAKKIIANSEGTKLLLVNHYPAITEVFVAPNGVDLKFFDISETREQVRIVLGLPQDRIIIGYVGRLTVAGMDKGVAMLKEAFGRMRYQKKAYLLIVGGPELSVPYRDVPLYLRAIDIGVLTFPGEQHAKTTSPIKYYEYLAAGKAIVRADSSSSQELANRLDNFVEHPEQIKISGEKDHFKAKDHTWDQRAQTIIKACFT